MGKPSVAVMGAGVFGAWSALRLAREGWRVTLVDAYGPANGRASSSDHSRVIRAGYGDAEIYTRWAVESLREWHWLARKTSVPLVVECGVLFLGEHGSPHLEATSRTLAAHGVTHERLTAAATASRYPQIGVIGLADALYEPHAGMLRARRAVAAAVATAERHGATYARAAVAAPDEDAPTPSFRLASGAVLEADHYVFACGPWLPSLWPRTVGARIRPTRQEVLHFGVPAGDDRFGVERLPVWIDFAGGVYGVPDVDGCGFKVGLDRHGPPIDPDTAHRVVTEDAVAAARACLARRFPGLMAAPLVDAHVCQYENTGSGDFLIDRHPAWPNVWLVGGGSGHGFKHGPAVGKHVADLLAGRATPEPRFALDAATAAAGREVF